MNHFLGNNCHSLAVPTNHKTGLNMELSLSPSSFLEKKLATETRGMNGFAALMYVVNVHINLVATTPTPSTYDEPRLTSTSVHKNKRNESSFTE